MSKERRKKRKRENDRLYERNQRKLADEAKELAIQKEKEMERENAAMRENGIGYTKRERDGV